MKDIVNFYSNSNKINLLSAKATKYGEKISIRGLAGSCLSVIVAATETLTQEFNHLVILPTKEQAAYFANDLEELFEEKTLDYTEKKILFYPSISESQIHNTKIENADTILQLNTLNRLMGGQKLIVVTYPEALVEKTPKKLSLKNNSTIVSNGENLSVDNLIDILDEYGFERVDFVTSSGEYAIRGGIIDIFSFAQQKPCRIEMLGDKVDSIRKFDIVSQMSVEQVDKFIIVPDLRHNNEREQCINNVNDGSDEFFLSYFDSNTIIWTKELALFADKIGKDTVDMLSSYTLIEDGNSYLSDGGEKFEYSSSKQMSFNQSFNLFAEDLQELTLQGYDNYFLVQEPNQRQRIERIIEAYNQKGSVIEAKYLEFTLSGGYIDNELRKSFFTDHELFGRYHKYTIQDNKEEREALTLEDLFALKPGDYITHIDYGVGKFAGLEKINNGGKYQEAIRLVYKGGDMLYVSIHALHKISKYSGKEGTEPKINRLGSSAWQTLKQKTKKRVKDIAKDLIKLYAERKSSKGFAFSEDNYLQNELEASFMYEDTIDQSKATRAVKTDMEKPYPMDRLICGDVGFGKTEIAIRAAFKAVCDSKQVAVLVPTTILAFQHYKTFSQRLKNMPCRVDYLNRFRSSKEKTQILKDLKDGKIDIIIGTHRIVGKDVEFKDLGLLIIDEEQKFGVGMKEKIRQIKVNIDTLTLTATPIPRTLQFSLMGARDLSIISTPPANRQPVSTTVSTFDKEIIRLAITKELSRGGQVFFVNNRIQNIASIADMIKSLVPSARVCVGHAQMEGDELEKVMLNFIDGEYDVLVATTIIENGLDIPNANTIIINNAQDYGLSDLHQLRGRVGRSNKKAYCYILVPSKEILTDDAYKRLQAIEEFSSIGSGFSIAMRDLDIRGAGNILGAQQSGFISEIGYDMYNKILMEAMQELRDGEFKDLYANSGDDFKRLNENRECTIETDFEVLIPDYYITNITERLKIYKELDGMNENQEIIDLSKELRDRFGKIPKETLDLFDIVRIRWNAKTIGINKITLKRSKMIVNFAMKANDMNKKLFENIMLFVNQYPQITHLKEEGENLVITIEKVNNISKAKEIINKLSS